MSRKQAPAATFFSVFLSLPQLNRHRKGESRFMGRCSAVHAPEARYFRFGKTFSAFYRRFFFYQNQKWLLRVRCEWFLLIQSPPFAVLKPKKHFLSR